MNIFQKTYISLFIFTLLGTVGNIELGQPIPTYGKIILVVTGILTLGKIIYLGGK